MFESLALWIRQVKNKLIPTETISQAIGTETALSVQMESAIDMWGRIYSNQAPWLTKDVRSLGIAATICGKVSRVATIEKQIRFFGSLRADYMNEKFMPLDAKLREQLEYALAKGGMMLKPYVSSSELFIECVQADRFVPTKINERGEIIGAVFIETLTRGDRYYTRLENHTLEQQTYTVSSTAYKSKSPSALGVQIPLSDLAEWTGLEEKTVISNVKRPLFGYFKSPHANHIDLASPLGESIFARAVDQLKEADEHWERYNWEFESAERSLITDLSAIKPDNPKKARMLIGGDFSNDGSFYQEYSPEIRETPFYAKLQAVFKRIEFNCGLAYGMISDPQSRELTATEVISSKQELFHTVTDIQRALETAIRELAYGMDVLATLYKLVPQGSCQVAFDWGDSILTDRDAERAIRLQEVAAGISSPVEYRMWRYHEDEETARKRLPDVGGLDADT